MHRNLKHIRLWCRILIKLGMDPLGLAQANEAIMRTRSEVQVEAFQYIEQVRNDLRSEAIQFSQQVASQASMESQVLVAETQMHASQLVDSARLEVEGIRNQAIGRGCPCPFKNLNALNWS